MSLMVKPDWKFCIAQWSHPLYMPAYGLPGASSGWIAFTIVRTYPLSSVRWLNQRLSGGDSSGAATACSCSSPQSRARVITKPAATGLM